MITIYKFDQEIYDIIYERSELPKYKICIFATSVLYKSSTAIYYRVASDICVTLIATRWKRVATGVLPCSEACTTTRHWPRLPIFGTQVRNERYFGQRHLTRLLCSLRPLFEHNCNHQIFGKQWCNGIVNVRGSPRQSKL